MYIEDSVDSEIPWQRFYNENQNLNVLADERKRSVTAGSDDLKDHKYRDPTKIKDRKSKSLTN